MKKNNLLYLLLLSVSLCVSSVCFCEDHDPDPEDIDVSAAEAEAEAAPSGHYEENVFPADIDQYITLCDYTALAGTRTSQAVSDYELDQRILSELSLSETYQKTNSPCAYGDRITIRLTICSGDTVLEQWDDDCLLTVGDALLGNEFDGMIVGKKAGDDFEFTISYPSTFIDELWAGKEITFKGSVVSVENIIQPVVTDKIVDQKTSFETVEDYRQYLLQTMQNEYDIAADEGLRAQLLTTVVTNSKITGYPQELYDRCEKEITQKYAAYRKLSQSSDTDDDEQSEVIQNETLALVNKRLVICALFSQADLGLSKQDCHDILQTISIEYGYDTLNDYLETMDSVSMVWTACERTAGNYLMRRMMIYDNTLNYSAEDLEMPLDLETDIGDVIIGLAEGGIPEED